jgi:hypothetical protein
VRSDIYIPPDGKHRAYAEVEATAIRPQRTAGYSGPLCVNNARLFVGSDVGDFRLVFLQEPSDTETGNSLRIVDWSVDGRRLLLELAQWQYDSPGVSRSPLVYDVNYGVFQQPDMNHVFSKQFGSECLLGVHVLGFSSEGKVAIETQPLSPEEEEVLAVASCSRKKAAWTLSVVSETLTPLPDTSKVQHYGKSEPQPTK